jgi:hypothetical protein
VGPTPHLAVGGKPHRLRRRQRIVRSHARAASEDAWADVTDDFAIDARGVAGPDLPIPQISAIESTSRPSPNRQTIGNRSIVHRHTSLSSDWQGRIRCRAVLDEAMGAVCWMNQHAVAGARITSTRHMVPLGFAGHVEALIAARSS